ncbi:hydrogenase iron-sulfur subunit [Halorussus limi]|uniref:Hydrogenase iron-sulfur subunit n=1 Tax=Halorussus limi TaxID=2938695 RepID=A0A8U0HS20_9EURY|nr:hydrogenase iron-sulfur subunit [Halorussus limi]UPV73770.1 hydrogenase iron-sulfur subunit [Halorussus limi]
MNTGVFVCSCADTCDVDLEGVREGVEDVDVVASSRLLCEDGLAAMDRVVDEYELDQLVVTAAESRCKQTFRELAAEKGLHPDAAAFVDHREGAGWVHDEPAATEKTARLLNARFAGLREEAVSRSVSREAGRSVAVVGDPETAAALADTADVTLVADGEDFADSDADLDDVTIERGRVAGVDGRYGDFEIALDSRVTEDCVGCMECVRKGPDAGVTRLPVDISLKAAAAAGDGASETTDGETAADGGTPEWVECCPTDAIDLSGVERTISADQVVYPGADRETRGGRVGFYTGPIDAGTIAAVEDLLGGVEKPKHLDLEMDVCASGESSQMGCNECVEACPHGAVERPRIDAVEFDEVACQDCGACTSACPTGATKLREPSNRRIAREVEALLEPPDSGGWLFGGNDPIGEQVVAFVCSERARRALRTYGREARSAGEDGGDADFSYHPILPVSVPCADAVGEAHAMHALAAGADGVALVGCGDECQHSGPDPKAELVERVNRAARDLGLGERATFLAPDPSDPETFAASLDEFAEAVGESPVPAGEYEATGRIADEDRPNPEFDGHGWTLESVRAILDHADPEREVIRGLTDFGRMAVSDDCALTPTCTNLCPTDAIRRREGDLQFNHQRCVDCGLCEQGCPESAIAMRDGLDLSLLPENRAAEVEDGEDPAWVTVMEGEMRECVRCGDPFASEASAEKIEGEVGDMVAGLAPDSDHSVFEYCGDCRARLLFEG